MQAYLLQTETRVAPFGDRPRDLEVLNEKVSEHQQKALQAAGCVVSRIVGLDEVSSFPCILLHDDLYLSEHIVSAFLKEAVAHGSGPSAGRLALAGSAFTRRTAPLQDLPPWGEGASAGLLYPLWLVAEPGQLDALETLPGIGVDPREWASAIELPAVFRIPGRPWEEASLAAHRAMRIRHWVHLHRANLDAVGGSIREAWEHKTLQVVWRYLRSWLSRPFTNTFMVRRGRGCKIHRTAVVEGCRLGDGVTIGAHAVVRASVLGDGVVVEEGAIVNLSVLGPRSWVSRNCKVFATVLLEGAFCAHRLTQASLLGRGALTTGGGYLIDTNFSGDVKVADENGLRDSGTHFLGVCLGHGVRMGTGIWIAAGRAIPNGYFLIQDPGDVLRKVPEGLPEGPPLLVRGGTLQPAVPVPRESEDGEAI